MTSILDEVFNQDAIQYMRKNIIVNYTSPQVADLLVQAKELLIEKIRAKIVQIGDSKNQAIWIEDLLGEEVL